MYRALTLAAGYILSYCIHTPQGRKMAKKAIDDALKRMGEMEKGVTRAFQTPKPAQKGSDT